MSEINVPDPWASQPEINIGGSIALDLSPPLPTNSFKIVIPQYVGWWEISGNFHVHVTKRPNRLNRLMTRLLLGWEWRDD